MIFGNGFRRRMVVLRDTPGEGGGGVPPAAAPPARETFSREYVHELREENKGYRIKHQEAVEAGKKIQEAAEAATKKAQEEADAKVSAATAAANERIVRAELKALAVKEGILDLDDLKLIDVAKVKIKDDGELEGAEDVIKAFKEAKPHKFGKPSSSSHEPPPKKPDGTDEPPKKASEMDKKEYEAAKRRLTAAR